MWLFFEERYLISRKLRFSWWLAAILNSNQGIGKCFSSGCWIQHQLWKLYCCIVGDGRFGGVSDKNLAWANLFETGNHIVEVCILFSFIWCINTKHHVFKGLPPFYRNKFGFWKKKKNCTSSSATSHLFHHFGLQLSNSRQIFWKHVKTCLEVLNVKPDCTLINICTILWSLSLSFLKLCVHILKIIQINENWNKMLFERRCSLEMPGEHCPMTSF